MEEMIIEAIEDRGAQGASLKQITEYISCTDIHFVEGHDTLISGALDSMMKSRIIFSRRNRFFMAYYD